MRFLAVRIGVDFILSHRHFNLRNVHISYIQHDIFFSCPAFITSNKVPTDITGKTSGFPPVWTCNYKALEMPKVGISHNCKMFILHPEFKIRIHLSKILKWTTIWLNHSSVIRVVRPLTNTFFIWASITSHGYSCVLLKGLASSECNPTLLEPHIWAL